MSNPTLISNRSSSIVLIGAFATICSSIFFTSLANAASCPDAVQRDELIFKARSGDSVSMLELGRVAKNCGATDLVQAWLWTNVAGLRQSDARAQREDIEGKMSPNQRLQAEDAALPFMHMLAQSKGYSLIGDPDTGNIWLRIERYIRRSELPRK